jgi:hypothetical protein
MKIEIGSSLGSTLTSLGVFLAIAFITVSSISYYYSDKALDQRLKAKMLNSCDIRDLPAIDRLNCVKLGIEKIQFQE